MTATTVRPVPVETGQASGVSMSASNQAARLTAVLHTPQLLEERIVRQVGHLQAVIGFGVEDGRIVAIGLQRCLDIALGRAAESAAGRARPSSPSHPWARCARSRWRSCQPAIRLLPQTARGIRSSQRPVRTAQQSSTFQLFQERTPHNNTPSQLMKSESMFPRGTAKATGASRGAERPNTWYW